MIDRYTHGVKSFVNKSAPVRTNVPHDAHYHLEKPVFIEWSSSGLMFSGQIFDSWGNIFQYKGCVIFQKPVNFPFPLFLFSFTYGSLFFNSPIGGLVER